MLKFFYCIVIYLFIKNIDGCFVKVVWIMSLDFGSLMVLKLYNEMILNEFLDVILFCVVRLW